jgi:hypothetical protein
VRIRSKKQNKTKNKKKMNSIKLSAAVTVLIFALGFPIIEPNVIPLEAAFQGKKTLHK